MNLMEIAFLILDEADRMFDMGFYPDLRKLIKAVPPADRRQTMLFSATLNAWVKNLAWEYTKNPFEIAIEPEIVTLDEVEQVLYQVSSTGKMKLLVGIIKREDPESTLIFCNTKRYAEIVAKRLRLNGMESEFIMGDLPQPMRLKIIDSIKTGKIRILVATDVAARGLDIEDLAMVVNYDLPNETENYVHRIGRTARAGKTGKAISFASEQDVYELPAIERYINRKIPAQTATEDLFAEDKSEGKHIYTDYQDEADSRPRHKDNRRDRKEKKPRPTGKPSGIPAEHPTESITRNFRKGVNLSELSLEERMAYYRQKYDKSGASRGAHKTTQKAQKVFEQKEIKRSDKKRDKNLDKKRDKKQKQEAARSKAPEARPQTINTNAGAALSPGEAVLEKGAKKSVLSMLTRLFRKKE
jgi:ATP-dependent RNA helicase RhlB